MQATGQSITVFGVKIVERGYFQTHMLRTQYKRKQDTKETKSLRRDHGKQIQYIR